MRQEKLYLRTVRKEDMDLLFQWANDREVRQNAFHTEPISYEEHQRWFSEHIGSGREICYILMESEEPIGQVRLSVSGDEAEISYSIKGEKRGQGYGNEILRLMIEKVREDYPGIIWLTAKVKPRNMASASCFIRNGFDEIYRKFKLGLG